METLKTSKENDIHSLSASIYKQELNELKIEKLGNRITIISFILPCLIGAIIFYAYVDINHRVVDAKDSGQTEIQLITREMEDKINAMNVEMARLKFSQEQQLPAITAQIEELSVLKANREETMAALETLEKEVAHTTDQYKAAIHIIDRTSKENLAIINTTGDRIKKNAEAFEQSTTQRLTTVETQLNEALKGVENRFNEAIMALETSIKKDIARMETLNLNLASYEMTMKTFGEDLAETKSAFNKKLKQTMSRQDLENINTQLKKKISRQTLTNGLDQISKTVDTRLQKLENKLSKALSAMEKRNTQSVASPKATVTKPNKKQSPAKSKPEPLIIMVPESGKISESDLTQ